MKLLFIKDFQDTPESVLYKGEIHTMWTTTGERALKEGKAVEVPEGCDELQFKKQYFETIKTKK